MISKGLGLIGEAEVHSSALPFIKYYLNRCRALATLCVMQSFLCKNTIVCTILENPHPSVSGINEHLKLPSPSRTCCFLLCEQLWRGAGVPGATHSAAQWACQPSGILILLWNPCKASTALAFWREGKRTAWGPLLKPGLYPTGL